MKQRRGYVLGGSISSALLAIGLVTGHMPMRFHDVSETQDHRGFVLIGAIYVVLAAYSFICAILAK